MRGGPAEQVPAPLLDLVREALREVVREEVQAAIAEALPPALTPEEVGQRYGVSARTVRDWIRSGRLRGVRITHHVVVIPADELRRFERRCLTGGPRPVEEEDS